MNKLRDRAGRIADVLSGLPSGELMMTSVAKPDADHVGGRVRPFRRDSVAAQAILDGKYRLSTPEEVKAFHATEKATREAIAEVEKQRIARVFGAFAAA